MKNLVTLTIDGIECEVNGERNLLEVIRKARIELPTFCYHSELSVYGACRLCMVDIEGRGLQPACSTPPEAGLKVRTNTEEIRQLRRIIVELLLANHEQSCPTCAKSASCQLQNLARRLGIKKVRFKQRTAFVPVDETTPSLVRDPNKCVLCGDCVRICSEVQGIGAIDFAHRGSKTQVLPAFGKNLDSVECVYCGQCSRVCPTGAIMPKSEVEAVWKELDSKEKTVVAQIAPAVRVALGEAFGLEPGTNATGQIVAALRALGFKKVYDTSFTADLTVVEEAEEFLARVQSGQQLPQFTSCCPAWVRFVEQYYPERLDQLSTCRSPQQMFGALAKEYLPQKLEINADKLVVVSIMPCTAKKYEARRSEFARDGQREVDYVLTTQELVRMIEEAGLSFRNLEPGSFDLPFGFKSGAGVIFGNSGGVSEAALRYIADKISPEKLDHYEFQEVRGDESFRETSLVVGERLVKLAVVSSLGRARQLMEDIACGKVSYDFVEVMACPGGCIGGAGQPVNCDAQVRRERTKGLYEDDQMLQLHKSQDNPYVKDLYKEHLGKIGGTKAHHLLHTNYRSRRRIAKTKMTLLQAAHEGKVTVDVCFGTNCFLKGAQNILSSVMKDLEAKGQKDAVEVRASFCFEKCNKGPCVKVADKTLERCSVERVQESLQSALANLKKQVN